MSKMFETEQSLREIYYDPLEGYSSATQLYRKAKEKGFGRYLYSNQKMALSPRNLHPF